MRIVSKRPSNRDPRRMRGFPSCRCSFHWKARRHSFAAQIAEIAQQRGEWVKSLRRVGCLVDDRAVNTAKEPGGPQEDVISIVSSPVISCG